MLFFFLFFPHFIFLQVHFVYLFPGGGGEKITCERWMYIAFTFLRRATAPLECLFLRLAVRALGKGGEGCALCLAMVTQIGNTPPPTHLISLPPPSSRGIQSVKYGCLIMENIQYCLNGSRSCSLTPSVSFSSCCHLIGDLFPPLTNL